MKVTGIIAEYNPFHNGHAYHIEQVRKKTGAEYIIAIMSGNFVQRGGPAIADKFVRAKMALLAGADLVIELPTVAATASAETFARTGVNILAATDVVTHLGFGCETNNLELLKKIATLFIEEPAEYQNLLLSFFKEGLTYPVARAKAASIIFSDIKDAVDETLNNPNNILAIEYLKALNQLNTDITPCPILRQGNHYHDSELTSQMSSATAIRSQIYSKNMNVVWPQIPQKAGTVLQEYFAEHVPLKENDFSAILHYKLLLSQNTLENYFDCKGDMANRIANNLEKYTCFSDFADMLKSKNQTHTSICRALTHILLDIREDDVQHLKATNYAPYIRVLGFRKSASHLLTKLKTAKVPVITKLSEGQEQILLHQDSISQSRSRILQIDIDSSHIFDAVQTSHTSIPKKSEYRKSLIYV